MEKEGVTMLEKGVFKAQSSITAGRVCVRPVKKKEGVLALEKRVINRICFLNIKKGGFALQLQKGVFA